jgi:hypothetical protein
MKILAILLFFLSLNSFADCTCNYYCVAGGGMGVDVVPFSHTEASCSVAALHADCSGMNNSHYIPAASYTIGKNSNNGSYVSGMTSVDAAACVADK